MTPFGHRHLLGIEGLAPEEIVALLDAADALASSPDLPAGRSRSLAGRTVVNLFFEASTRTRTSFELAAKRLGADAVTVSSGGSSISKGETLLDTVRTIEAMRADVVVVRHSASGAPHQLAAHLDAAGSPCAIVNAGDGMHEHPTQALLDALTIRRAKGRRDDFAGLVVAIAGDVLHSRVARSNAILLTMLGATVRIAAPRTFVPPGFSALRPSGAPGHITIVGRLEEALDAADVVMMLRVQRERLAGGYIPSTREYARTFGLSEARLSLAKSDAIVMHPGPLNRGVEIDDAVANGPRSFILDQVAAGVAIRMAVLEALGSPERTLGSREPGARPRTIGGAAPPAVVRTLPRS